jgi:molybdate transport system ATP-binding protein
VSEPGGLEAEVRLRRGDLDLDVGVAVAPGEVVAVVGPNAAGKSTFLAAVAGLVPVAAGRVRLGDRLLDDPAAGTFVPPERRSVGLVFQDLLLFPHLSVLDNVAFGLRRSGTARGEARRQAAAALDRLGVAGLAGARPATLPGWRWPGPSPPTRCCSSSTSRWRPSTSAAAPSCARPCGRGCGTGRARRWW